MSNYVPMNPSQLPVPGVAYPQMCNPSISFTEGSMRSIREEIAIEEERKRKDKYGKKVGEENYDTGSRMRTQKEIRVNGQPQVGHTTLASNC